MLLRHALVLLMISVATSGCDQITGAAEKKISDAEAIGYACRVSLKKPEDCMKENEVQSTTSVLAGWKAADKDIAERTLDPSMGSDPATAVILKSASPASKKTDKKDEESKVEKAPDAESAPEEKPTKTH